MIRDSKALDNYIPHREKVAERINAGFNQTYDTDGQGELERGIEEVENPGRSENNITGGSRPGTAIGKFFGKIFNGW